jgi:hypothetical protein
MAAVDLFDGLNTYLVAFPFSLPVRTKKDLLQLNSYLCEGAGNKNSVVDFLVAVASVSHISAEDSVDIITNTFYSL